MAKDMYQKREERKNKPEEENGSKTNISWDICIYGNTRENPYKISVF